jgi:parallel beta-helix repeat protein
MLAPDYPAPNFDTFVMIPRLSLRALVALVTSVALAPAFLSAQPSGGPYGPVQQRYDVPAGAAHVHYVAPDGKAEVSGATLAEPTTLAAAIERAVTGDAIILRGGTYRTGNLLLNQGITLQPYADERPVLKGTQVATEWEALRNGVWRTSWKTLFPQKPADWWRRNREGMRTPLHRFNNDMVFVDGRALQSAAWEGGLDANTYSIDYENGHVFLGFDPANHLIEVTAFDGAITRTTGAVHGRKSDGKGPVIRGLTFTQYAYRALEVEGREPDGPADPATFGKEVVGTTLEHVTITHCSRVAGYLRGDRITIRNCLISDTSTEGIYIISSADCLLERNIFARNNVEQITGYYPSAVKIFNQSYRVTCRDNLVIDQPNSNGIWWDVGNVDGVFVNNWVENCQNGFFFEISKGAICAGNVFVNCDKGIAVLNSSNVHAWQNTLVNSVASFERTTRSAVGDHFGWHPATGPDVDEREGHIFANNLLVGVDGFRRELLRFEQTASLCDRLTKPQVAQLDGNVFVRTTAVPGVPLIVWSPAKTQNCLVELATLADFQKLHPALEANGREFSAYGGPLFKNPLLKRYELQSAFTGATSGLPLPNGIRELLAWPKQAAAFPGAYAPAK